MAYFMTFRIQAFDNVYRVRLWERLRAIGPDQDPDDHRAMLAELIIPPPTPLVRQTNRHHLLSEEKLVRFWAGNREEREELMDELDQAEEAEEVRARAAARAQDWQRTAQAWWAATEAEEAAAAAAAAAAEAEQDELPEDDEERGARELELGPLYYEDFDEVAAVFLE
jgi:hypothetical protein